MGITGVTVIVKITLGTALAFGHLRIRTASLFKRYIDTAVGMKWKHCSRESIKSMYIYIYTNKYKSALALYTYISFLDDGTANIIGGTAMESPWNKHFTPCRQTSVPREYDTKWQLRKEPNNDISAHDQS